MASDVPTQNSQKPNIPHDSSSTTTSYSSSLLSLIGSVALAVSYLIVAFLSRGALDPTTFAVLSLLTLLLFLNLRLFEKAEPNSAARESIKLPVWLLAALLTLMFTRRLAALMPWAVAIVMWSMSGTTILVGFYFIFLHRDPIDARIHDQGAPKLQTGKVVDEKSPVQVQSSVVKLFV